MVVVGKALSALGRNGPLLLVMSLGAGAISKPLSEISAHVIAVSAFLLTFGSFLSAHLSPPEGVVRRMNLLLILGSVGLLVPLTAYWAAHVLRLAPDMELAVTLSFLAPPVGSAAAIAAMLRLRPKLALVVSVSLTLAAPLLMPAALGVLGADIQVAFDGITLRLFGIVTAAALATVAVARWRDRLRPVLPDAGAAAGISVIGLVIVGLAVTSGLSPALMDGSRVASLVGLALGLNVAAVALGTMLFLSMGLRDALTVGFLAGNRNVTLAWAAAGGSLPEDAKVYLVVCVIPVLALPLLIRLAYRVRALVSAPAAAAVAVHSAAPSPSEPTTPGLKQ